MDADQAANVLIKLSSIRTPVNAATATLEAAMAVWDNYKAKIEEVAKTQVEATGKIMASANEAMATMKALNEALHPLTTTADKDEQDLARRIDQLKTTQEQQKEINKANEGVELASATNEDQKTGIKEKYRILEAGTDGLTQSQIAGLQAGAAEQAQKQIDNIHAQIAARQARLDAGNARLKGEADESQFKSDTQRATIDSVLQLGRLADQVTKLLGQKTGEHETLQQLLDKIGASHEQTQNLLQLILTKHLALSNAVDQMHQQLLSRQNQPIGQ